MHYVAQHIEQLEREKSELERRVAELEVEKSRSVDLAVSAVLTLDENPLYVKAQKLRREAEAKVAELESQQELIAKEAIGRAAMECDKRTTALDYGGNPYKREATASQCANAIRSLSPAEIVKSVVEGKS